ncbi:dimethylaniline monooxygenase [N-oxide-forming] [Elysia marginata]|uniref:Flavin-containing monooxygenase n=1 Tax=Elysia marginata TaxID=1093978 RepID=A0AAV4H4J5_9GAST|nr:dimethylaniline monooxygenase [N-oxide-forming] [Elysia marginata]
MRDPRVYVTVFRFRLLGLLYTGTGLPLVSNDDIQVRIMSGKVKVIGHLKEFKGSEVTTVDGRLLEGVDSVILATGYDHDLSVLDQSLGLDQKELNLYKQVFPIHEKHHTLALVGCLRVSGPNPTAMELQSRMAAYTLSGRHKLPTFEVMKADSDRWKDLARRSDGSYRFSYISVMVYEELAAEIGVAPYFWPLVFSGKPKLAVKALLGPLFPFVYRLVGPGAWEGAESAMEKALEENKQSLCNRTLPTSAQFRETLGLPAWTRALALLAACLAMYAYLYGI